MRHYSNADISNLVLLIIMQVLVYHDLLGMLQHPHHAKVFTFTANDNLVFLSNFIGCNDSMLKLR